MEQGTDTTANTSAALGDHGGSVDLQALPPHGDPCRSCGCPVEADDKFCPACGTPSKVTVTSGTGSVSVSPPPFSKRPSQNRDDHEHETDYQREHQAPAVDSPEAASPEDDRKYFHCESCGADVATDPDQRSYVCPFCDSTYVTEYAPSETGRQSPEFVIGFAVTPEQSVEKFRQWIGSNSWFRPSGLKLAKLEEKLRGVYLPFWSFSMLARSHWSANIGEYWYRTETYTTTDSQGKTVTRTRQVQETEWWGLSGKHHDYYSGYLVSGSNGLSQKDADRIKPFNLPSLKRYAPYYLAGWLAEEYTIDRDTALNRSQQYFYDYERQAIAAFLPGDTHRGLQVQTDFDQINSDLCLLPIYVASYRFQNKLYRFLLNGQTGKVAGDKPVSGKRIAGAIIGGIVALVILWLILRGMGS